MNKEESFLKLSCFSRGDSRKKGAADWTIGKLLAIVLLIVFLALVIYGVSVGGLNPLIDRAGGMVDSVLLLFSVGDDDSGIVDDDGCVGPYSVEVTGVGKGMLTKCRGSCSIDMEDAVGGYKGSFKYEDGKFSLEKGLSDFHKYFLEGDNVNLSFSYFSLDLLEYLEGIPASTSERIFVPEGNTLPKVKQLHNSKTLYLWVDHWGFNKIYWTDYGGNWFVGRTTDDKELFNTSDVNFFRFLEDIGKKRDVYWKLGPDEMTVLKKGFDNPLFEDGELKEKEGLGVWFSGIREGEVGEVEPTSADVKEYINMLWRERVSVLYSCVLYW